MIQMENCGGGGVQERNGEQVQKKCSLRNTWSALVWHGGSAYDAWLNAVAAQMGSSALTLPQTLAQMGYVYGVASQILYDAFGCWTVYLLSLFHTEASQRARATGIIHEKHVLQYHEVISLVSGRTLGFIVLALNMIALFFACVLQIPVSSSHVYYINSSWTKREWLHLFGIFALPSVLLPSLHNFRIISLIGIATISITSAYMALAARHCDQIEYVSHEGPTFKVDFFAGATNVLISFGSLN